MSNLEAYILNKYSRWVPFKDCSAELLFDIEEALGVRITKECESCEQIVLNSIGAPIGGLLTPKLQRIKYKKHHYAISEDHIDFQNGGLLYSTLAKLILLNAHLDKEIT